MLSPNRRRILSVLCGLLIAASVNAATLKENFDKTIPLKAGSVTLRNINGAVTFEAWDRDEVRVEAEKKVKAGTDGAARKAMSQVRIEVTPSAGGLRIETKMPKQGSGFFDWLFNNQVNINVTYRVHVPRRAGVDAETVNGGVALAGTRGKVRVETTNGGIDVKDVQGDVNASSTNGGITATRITGAVKAGTTNGAIEADLVDFPEGSDLQFETTNGGITVRLPRDARLSVDASTTNGRVQSDFEVPGAAKGKRSLEGDINGGGGRLVLSTTNGSIEILEH
jgi:Putative adhesin